MKEMRILLLVAACASLLTGCAAPQFETDYSIPVSAEILARARDLGLGVNDFPSTPRTPAPADDTEFLKLFCPQFGLTFPNGSSLLYDEKTECVIMTNTKENCELVKAMFSPL